MRYNRVARVFLVGAIKKAKVGLDRKWWVPQVPDNIALFQYSHLLIQKLIIKRSLMNQINNGYCVDSRPFTAITVEEVSCCKTAICYMSLSTYANYYSPYCLFLFR